MWDITKYKRVVPEIIIGILHRKFHGLLNSMDEC